MHKIGRAVQRVDDPRWCVCELERSCRCAAARSGEGRLFSDECVVWEALLDRSDDVILTILIGCSHKVHRLCFRGALALEARQAVSTLLVRHSDGSPQQSLEAARAANGSLDVVFEPSFRRLAKAKRTASVQVLSAVFRDALVVDDVHSHRGRERAFAAFRWLMQAQGHPAVWQNPAAFARADCAGCEAAYFPAGST